jgi:drug/metabolite transporter (DMT)-like permease
VSGKAAAAGGSHRLRGYAMVGSTAVMFGATGVWVGMTDLPASTVLTMRMALAAAIVVALGGGRRWLRQSLQPGVLRRLIVLGALDAVQLYTFMLALRQLDVALAVFLSYMSPIYIALIAPRLLRQRTETVVVAALVLAVSGIVVMLAPGVLDPGLRASSLGVALGLVSGLLLAAFFLVAKALSGRVDGSTMLISNGVIVAVVMLPLGLIQWAGAGWAFGPTDLWAVLGLAVFSTALGGTVFLHGMRYIPVQHTSIVGLLEPASAPAFALVFLAERPSVWTLLGGVLILVGAVLVVVFGAADEGLAGSPEEAVGEAEATSSSGADADGARESPGRHARR